MSLAIVAWPCWLVESCKVSLTQSSWQSPAASREKITVCQRLRLGCKHAIPSSKPLSISRTYLVKHCPHSAISQDQIPSNRCIDLMHNIYHAGAHVWCLIGGFLMQALSDVFLNKSIGVQAKLSHRIQDPLPTSFLALRDFLYFSPSWLGPGARWQHQHHCPNAVETPQLGALSPWLHRISQAPPLTFRII